MKGCVYMAQTSNPVVVSTAEVNNLKSALTNIDTKELKRLDKVMKEVKKTFKNFGIEICALPKRLMGLTSSTLQLIGSLNKLNKLKVHEEFTKQFSRGLTDAQRQSENFGKNSKEIFRGIGKTTQNTFKSMGKSINKTVGNLKDKLVALKANGVAKSALTGITGLLEKAKIKLTKSFKGIKALLAPKNILLGIKAGLKLALKGVLIALNVVKGIFIALWKLSPIGMIAGAVALAVVGIQSLVSWFNRASDASVKFGNRNKEVSESISEINNRLASNREAHADNLISIERSTAVNGRLIERLKDLNDIDEMNDAQRAQKIATIRELNGRIEGLNLVYCEETGLLDENSQRQFEQLGLRNDIADATNVAETHQSRLNEALYEEQELLAKIQDLDFPQKRKDLTAALEDGSISQREYNDLVKDMEANYISLNEELKYTQQEIQYLDNAWYSSLTHMTNLTDQYVTDQRLTWDSLSSHQQGVMNTLKSMITDYTAHAQNRMTTLSDEVTVTGRDMIDNMIENQ